MFLNYLFVFAGFILDGVLNVLFPAQFNDSHMFFVPCMGICSMILVCRKMKATDAIILSVLFGMGYDFFYANTIFVYTVVFVLLFGVTRLWGKQINESMIESVSLCISTIFIKELMIYLFMKLSNQTIIGINSWLVNRLFLTLLINGILVSLLVFFTYVKDDYQKRKEVRIRKEERLPWMH